MGMSMSVYVGPYLVLPKDFDWWPFDEIVTCGRGESSMHDSNLILIPNRELENDERPKHFHKNGDNQDIVRLLSLTAEIEVKLLAELAKPLVDHCIENGVSFHYEFGIVPSWS